MGVILSHPIILPLNVTLAIRSPLPRRWATVFRWTTRAIMSPLWAGGGGEVISPPPQIKLLPLWRNQRVFTGDSAPLWMRSAPKTRSLLTSWTVRRCWSWEKQEESGKNPVHMYSNSELRGCPGPWLLFELVLDLTPLVAQEGRGVVVCEEGGWKVGWASLSQRRLLEALIAEERMRKVLQLLIFFSSNKWAPEHHCVFLTYSKHTTVSLNS